MAGCYQCDDHADSNKDHTQCICPKGEQSSLVFAQSLLPRVAANFCREFVRVTISLCRAAGMYLYDELEETVQPKNETDFIQGSQSREKSPPSLTLP